MNEQSEDGKEPTPKNLTEPDADDVQEEERKVTMNKEESNDSDSSSDKSEGAKQADEEQWATKALKKKNSVLVLQE